MQSQYKESQADSQIVILQTSFVHHLFFPAGYVLSYIYLYVYMITILSTSLQFRKSITAFCFQPNIQCQTNHDIYNYKNSYI